MANVKFGDLLNRVGQCVAGIVDYGPEGAYLYVECDGGSCEAGVFHEKDDTVTYYDPDDDLFDALYALWNVTEPDKKWEIMEYGIAGDAFDARFMFPDQLDPDETSYDRRQRALRSRFGDKPVIYPPMDDGFREITESDLSSE